MMWQVLLPHHSIVLFLHQNFKDSLKITSKDKISANKGVLS